MLCSPPPHVPSYPGDYKVSGDRLLDPTGYRNRGRGQREAELSDQRLQARLDIRKRGHVLKHVENQEQFC